MKQRFDSSGNKMTMCPLTYRSTMCPRLQTYNQLHQEQPQMTAAVQHASAPLSKAKMT